MDRDSSTAVKQKTIGHSINNLYSTGIEISSKGRVKNNWKFSTGEGGRIYFSENLVRLSLIG